ncbi:sulfurtransferase TusA family protein [Kordiimonas marina]|uniref:sulfurtransferase TusA family protein n=1 Tax=Kordiimonas marina TaxID=2872312 RepID=UPI003CCFF1F1|nr:sulfurtransferase TusA family protein [Kordiimonas marina]
MQTTSPRRTLDLRGTTCPMAFVKTRLFLDTLVNGDIASIVYEKTRSNEPLVRSIRSLGHEILSETDTHSLPSFISADVDAASRPPVNTLQLIVIEVQVKK